MAQVVQLPEDKRLLTQLVQLERRTSRVGRDTVGPPPNGHDDVSNAVAGAAVLAYGRGRVAFKGMAEAIAKEQGRAPAPEPGAWTLKDYQRVATEWRLGPSPSASRRPTLSQASPRLVRGFCDSRGVTDIDRVSPTERRA